MLKNTFCHIPGVGIRKEQQLWGLGVHAWDHLIESDHGRLPLGKNRVRLFKNYIDQSIIELQQNNPNYFFDLLPSDQHWRMFPDFRDSVAYLDIETTGMGGFNDYITTIALYDGKFIRWYVQGENMEDFTEDIRQYKVVVTYNGKCFDLPFIRSHLRISMDQAHIDLRYVLKSLGYKGGLKGCEKQLGIDRKELDGVDGFFAVLLWNDYKRSNDRKALETLLAYNILDVVNLEYLMVMSYNLKVKSTPFHETHALPLPSSPAVPFEPDVRTIDRVKRLMYSYPYSQGY